MIPADCTTCGACCWHPTDPRWIEVTLEDATRLPAGLLLVPGDVEPYALLQRPDGRCSLLEGTCCARYEQRPAVCQRVQRGDAVCLAALQRKAVEAFCARAARLCRLADVMLVLGGLYVLGVFAWLIWG